MSWVSKQAKRAVKIFIIVICIINFIGLYFAVNFVVDFSVDFDVVDEARTNALSSILFLERSQDHIDDLILISDVISLSLDEMDSRMTSLAYASKEVADVMSILTGNDYFLTQSNAFYGVANVINTTKVSVDAASYYVGQLKDTSSGLITAAKSNLENMPTGGQMADKFIYGKNIILLMFAYFAILNFAFMCLAIIA